jgi:hypothetical protein
VHDGVVHWKTEDLYHKDGEHWVVGTYKDLQTQKCVSEYLHHCMSDYVGLHNTDEADKKESISKTYYLISKEREDELRRAYETDRQFTVNNLTTAFHAATLKVMYPKLNVTMDTSALPPQAAAEESTEEAQYRKALQFLEQYILV